MIELLVVIGIIALLAGLLVPALSMASGQARFSSCRSNVRQLTIGVIMYVSDHGRYPSSIFIPKQSPYSPAVGVWRCPSDKNPQLPPFPLITPFSSYGYNAWGVTVNSRNVLFGLGLEDHPFLSESQVVSPSQMIATGDGFQEIAGKVYSLTNFYGVIGMNLTNAWGLSTDQLKEIEHRVQRRHSARANVGYCDGHVEGARFGKLFAWKDETLRRWNRDNQPHQEQRRSP